MRLRILVSGILFICSFLTTTSTFAFPTFSWIVADNSQPSPKNVGFVVSVSTEFDVASLANPSIPDLPRHVLAIVPIPKVPGPDSWKIGLRIHPDEIPYTGALFFTGTTCQGDLWIGEFQVNGEFDPAFDPHVVVGSGDPNSRILIVADPDAPLSGPMDFNSILSRNGECNQITRTMQAKPGIDLLVDLHQMFPPPYTLWFEFTP